MNILFLVNSYFPYGVAFSSRAVAFCALLKTAGHDVHVITMRSKVENTHSGENYSYNGCTYECATEKPEKSIESFIPNPQFIPCIKRYIETHSVDVAITSSCPLYFKKLLKLFRERKIPLILEQCEWYDSSNYTLGKFDPRYVRSSRYMNGLYCKADGIIAISRLLEKHYQERGVNTIRIPTILDVENSPYRIERNDNQKKVVVYTGSPGKSKEYLRPMIEVLATSKVLREKIEFHIYGPSEKVVLENIDGAHSLLDKAKGAVFIHGRVPQEQIQEILLNADYQIFLRPSRQSSNAGFPTKLGESMAVGTPIISNKTGDISLYVKDGINGFLLEDTSDVTVYEKMIEILRLTKEDEQDIRFNAREVAEKAFDSITYIPHVASLIKQRSTKHNAVTATSTKK